MSGSGDGGSGGRSGEAPQNKDGFAYRENRTKHLPIVTDFRYETPWRCMVRPRLYKNNAEKQKSYRKTQKPYYTKRNQIRQALEDLASLEQKALEGVYDVLVIDPPWPVAFQARDARPQQTNLQYSTMSLEAIRALRLPLAETAHVWLWTTQRFLPEAFGCLTAWGLTYSCCFVWHKGGGMQPMGLPQMNCEFALYARKGAALFLETAALATCFEGPRDAHSAKPEQFYAMVRRSTAGRRLDMFNRRQIDGFDGWGYEAHQGTCDA